MTLFDLSGLPLRKDAVLRALPVVPETGWTPPTYFPNLDGADVIAFDCEVRERDFAHGPGWGRGAAQVVGFSIAAQKGNERGKWYFPIRHTVEGHWNVDAQSALSWVKPILENPRLTKVGANLIYDVGNFADEGINAVGPFMDVQFAEALLDEEAFVGLDALSRKYLRTSKTSELMYRWLSQAYGGTDTDTQRQNIWRCPPRLVGPYAEDDAALPLDIIHRQWPLLEAEGLVDLFRMENKLIPIIVKMRLDGVTVDLATADQIRDKLIEQIKEARDECETRFGYRVKSYDAASEVAKLFDMQGLSYRHTETGKPSFQKEWLKEQNNPVAEHVIYVRELEKIKNTFIEGYILERARPVAGTNSLAKLHCSFHPLKGDDGGTKTGRFASSDPNLQNIPSRTKVGKLVRSAFVPDHGHEVWEKDDYSQIEYRMLANFARDRGDGSAERLRATYRANPKTDYHDKVFEMVCPLMGWDFNDPDKELRALRRKPIKNINFGLIYGQTEKSLAYKAGFTPAQAKEFFAAYHSAAPYVKPTMKYVSEEVEVLGYVRTLLGRRTRFRLWVPKERGAGFAMPLPYHEALREYGNSIKRANAYKGTNYKFQGSAADVLKAALVRAWEDGVFDVIGYPRLQVHDELDFSVIEQSPRQDEAYAYLHHVLETALPCAVPIVVDHDRAANWADCG